MVQLPKNTVVSPLGLTTTKAGLRDGSLSSSLTEGLPESSFSEMDLKIISFCFKIARWLVNEHPPVILSHASGNENFVTDAREVGRCYTLRGHT